MPPKTPAQSSEPEGSSPSETPQPRSEFGEPQVSNCDLASQLIESYRQGGSQRFTARELPSPPEVTAILTLVRELLLPGSTGCDQPSPSVLHSYMEGQLATLRVKLVAQLCRGLRYRRPTAPSGPCECEGQAVQIAAHFMAELPELRRLVLLDVAAAYDGDPAASSVDEVIFSYPGIRAVSIYRIAHTLWRLGALVVPRMMSEQAHADTGIDIHPGAHIGHSLFIDHGTGVVIGETTRIGDRVRIYQGVTLGALSLPSGTARKQSGQRRHPTIEDDVIIYANATILGGNTVIGRGAIVGGNTWVTESVAAGGRTANPCR